jgi:hypothetical protein
VKHDASADEVLIVELGSDTVKFGWSTDLEPRVMLNAVAEGNLFSAVVDGRDPDYAGNMSAQLSQLMRVVLAASDYSPKNGLLVYSSLPTVSNANEDLIELAMKVSPSCRRRRCS